MHANAINRSTQRKQTSQTSQQHYMMPLDKVREEEDLSESSTVELKMPPSPTSMSASSPDDTENEAVPSLEPTDSWEDSNDDADDNDDGRIQNKEDQPQTSFSTLSRKLDDFLIFWNEWSSSSLRTDQGLKLLQWSFWAASRLTAPGTPTPGYRGNFNRRYLNPELSPALRKCYADMSLVRYCLRLYGLPSSIEAVRSGSWSAGWEDPRIHKLGKIMAWSMAVYYPFEHVAFTGFVVPKFSRQFVDENRWSAISCRFWSIFIVSDFASSVLKLKELAKRRENVAREIHSGSITENEVRRTGLSGLLPSFISLHLTVFIRLHSFLSFTHFIPWTVRINVIFNGCTGRDQKGRYHKAKQASKAAFGSVFFLSTPCH